MNIEALVDYIILIGALCVAIGNIYKFFAKPTSHFKQKAIMEERERISEALKAELPPILLAHDLETRNKYLSDREAYLAEIKGEVLKDIKGTLDELKTSNNNQSEVIDVLIRTSKDVLREKIMAIYHKNKRTKSMALYEREALEQYYIDYKAEKGNSYIDKYYNRMKLWETIDSDEDDLP